MTARQKIKRIILIALILLIPLINSARSGSGSLTVVRVEGRDYLSFVEIARTLNIGFAFDMNLQRGRLYYEDRLAIFSVGFPVIISNGMLLKSDYPVTRHRGMVLLPVDTASAALKSFFPGMVFRSEGSRMLYSFAEIPVKPEDSVVPVDPVRHHEKITFIVIDPGHGGKDPGAIGVDSMREKDTVLSLSKAIESEMKKRFSGIRIVLTRSNDRFIELAERTEMANKLLKKGENGIFLSIHVNASVSPKVSGFETYFLSQNPSNEEARKTAALENDVIILEEKRSKSDYEDVDYIEALMMTTQIQRESSKLAEFIQNSVTKRIKTIKPNGVRKADFFVLRGVLMPAVLIEAGYITNPRDAAYLKNRHNHPLIARGIVDGVAGFISEFEKGIFP